MASLDELAMETPDPKVLTLDIETSPNVVYAWGLYDQNIGVSQVIETSRVLCVAAKWLDSRDVIFVSEFHDGRAKMLATMWDLVNEADIVVGYNHVSFYMPHLNREWFTADYGPPSPYQNVDLYRVNRSQFKFASNKLGYVTERLGLDTKIETGGQALWNRVLANDPEAWDLFAEYNATDVLITEALFMRLRAWIKLPHLGLWTGEMSHCYSCESPDLTPAGTVYAKANAWPKLLCEDCGAWNRMLKNGQTRAA